MCRKCALVCLGTGRFWCISSSAVILAAFAWSRAVTQPIERDAIYRRRRFSRDVIETCVRWYLTYRLSYRDLVALMAERDVRVAHTTIMRWIFRYVPEYERRGGTAGRSRSARLGASTRPSFAPGRRWATCIVPLIRRVRQWTPCSTRGVVSLQPWPFFARRLPPAHQDGRERFTLDGHKPSHLGLRRLGREDPRWKYVLVRRNQ